MSWKGRAKQRLLDALSRLTGRHPVLLPAQAAAEESILRLRAPYRVEGGHLDLHLDEPAGGTLSARLLAYEGHFPTRPLWHGEPRLYPGPCRLRLDLAGGEVQLDGQPWGRAPAPLADHLDGRRFAWELRLELPAPSVVPPRTRLTGHYLPGAPGATDETYFTGANYVDHEAESAGDAEQILALLRRHGGTGPVLEVGCATGGVLAALGAAGYESWGVDFSPWAVERARRALGRERAFVCDVERDPLPTAVCEQGPYGCLVLWAVLEHFARPFETLGRLGERVRPEGLLVINTTNASSLARSIFGEDWEGHFDPTHLGVEEVSAASLCDRLPALGWEIEELHTTQLWSRNADPTAAALRDLYADDARFRRLLEERRLGDFVQVVARRRGAA